MADEEQPAGPLLDALGVTLPVESNQQLVECLVIGKVVDFSTDQTRLALGSHPGLDWIGELGLLHAALKVISLLPLED